MGGYHPIFRAIVKKFNSLFSALTFEYVKIFYNKLIFFSPSNSKTRASITIILLSILSFLFFLFRAFSFELFESTDIEEIEYFFIVNLEERTEYRIMSTLLFILLDKGEHVLNGTLRNSNIVMILVRKIFKLRSWLFLSLHCESFSTSSLTICKYSCMIALKL